MPCVIPDVAQSRLTQLAQEVARGEGIMLFDDGKPVAQ